MYVKNQYRYNGTLIVEILQMARVWLSYMIILLSNMGTNFTDVRFLGLEQSITKKKIQKSL